MATTDLTAGSGAIPEEGPRRVYWVKNTCSPTIAQTANADVLQCMDIRANTLVLGTVIKITTAGVAATSITANVGITGGTVDGFDAAINLMAAANTYYKSTPSDTYPAAGGHIVTTTDSIDLVLAVTGAVTTAPAFTIWALCVDLN